MILQRPIEREQMRKLLATGKTDLLQFVSVADAPAVLGVSREAGGRQDRLRIRGEGARPQGARGRRAARRYACSARIRKDKQPVELHAGRYGPYVKHGDDQRDAAGQGCCRFPDAR